MKYRNTSGIMYTVSRLWNKVMLFLGRFFLHRIWDYTRRNKTLVDDSVCDLDYLEILTALPKRARKEE
jgi:hypothetical protein